MQHLRLHSIASPERARAVAQHPASGGSGASVTSSAATLAATDSEHVTLRAVPAAPDPRTARERSAGTERDGQDGSLVTEYGLLAVVAATVAGVVIQWASNGALVSLFNALLEHARSLVGA
ncbi:MAG: hypothetical protein WD638_11855 [Nitriliruptoraceae bacterium]